MATSINVNIDEDTNADSLLFVKQDQDNSSDILIDIDTDTHSSMDITQLLAFSVDNNASDLHLSADLPPMIRIDGDVKRINAAALNDKAVHSMIYDITEKSVKKKVCVMRIR